ncbi:MAG: MarP family serine protease [Nocardioidaceae bacterium]
MNGLDWLLILIVIAYAFSGYRQGFVVGATSTFGLLSGGYFGVVATPMLLDRFAPSMSLSVIALFMVLVFATLGQAVGALIGSLVRERITWEPVRALDAVGGAALSSGAVLLVAWALAVAVTSSQLSYLGNAVRTSEVLRGVNAALPGEADKAVQAFSDIVNSSMFPRYLDPFATEHIRPVTPPGSAIANKPGVDRAAYSVVKVLGTSSECGESVEGSGFVFAADRVMTNAHVVAGVSDPVVELDGLQYDAVTVLYDRDTDVAVLAVDRLDAHSLRFATNGGKRGRTGAVLGFPENGPYDVEPARIRDEQRLSSPDIYGSGQVVRDVFSLYAKVRPGNSGGPLVSARGRVLGVVFAASVSDSHTGYALTADQVTKAAHDGIIADEEVGTGGCT